MILQVFSVYDVKAHCFCNPFMLAHVDLAKRAFSEAARSPSNPVGKYPADHNLYHLGAFDDGTAEFSLFPQPKLIVAGDSLVPVAVYEAPEGAANVR